MKRMDEEHRRLISEANRGARHWRTQLTDENVLAVLACHGKATANSVSAELARKGIYISIAAVYSIWSGRTWAHVTGVKRTVDKKKQRMPGSAP